MKTNEDLLNSIYKTAKMGEETLKSVLKEVDDTDLRGDLQTQIAGYTQFCGKAQQEMAKHNAEAHDIPGMTKLSSAMGVKLNTLIDKTPSHIADMVIQVSTMGVVKMTEQLNHSPNAPSEIRKLTNDLVAFEQGNIERMKSYL